MSVGYKIDYMNPWNSVSSELILVESKEHQGYFKLVSLRGDRVALKNDNIKFAVLSPINSAPFMIADLLNKLLYQHFQYRAFGKMLRIKASDIRLVNCKEDLDELYADSNLWEVISGPCYERIQNAYHIKKLLDNIHLQKDTALSIQRPINNTHAGHIHSTINPYQISNPQNSNVVISTPPSNNIFIRYDEQDDERNEDIQDEQFETRDTKLSKWLDDKLTGYDETEE